MRALPTWYGGYRFRSRLEARWALFLTRVGLDWQYEPQGFLVGQADGDPRPYLPDFYVPTAQLYLEVKPSFADRVDPEGVRRWELFAAELAEQYPDVRTAMMCGAIPDPETVTACGPPSPDERWGHHATGARYGDGIYVHGDWDYAWCACPSGEHIDIQFGARGNRITCACEPFLRTADLYTGNDVRIVNAYAAARGERFEGGR